MMIGNKLTKLLLVGSVLVAMLSTVIVAGCSNSAEPAEGREFAAAVASHPGSESGGESEPERPKQCPLVPGGLCLYSVGT